MTPTDLETIALARYNATGDSFYSSTEIYELFRQAHFRLATEAFVIEDKDTSVTTVTGTRGYALPSNTYAIKRVEWYGRKLDPIDFREDDALTLSNADTTSQGDPQYYSEWDGYIYLRPIPSSARGLTIYRYKIPATYVASTTIEVPDRWSYESVYSVLSAMAEKDNNLQKAQVYRDQWEASVRRARMEYLKRKHRDGFSVVKDYETLPRTVIGLI